MKFRNIVVAAAVVMALPAVANAITVTNAGFETGYAVNTEFGSRYSTGSGPTGWNANGYALYFSGATATTANAAGEYSSSGAEKLWATGGIFTGTNHFVALDGDTTAGVQGSIWQTIGGLTVGSTYTVAFDWAAAQLQSRTGATSDSLQVTFGGSTLTTAILPDASQGFADGGHVTMNFVASSVSQVLTFLSAGSPVGLPPIALLDNVSVTAQTVHATVPEPASIALMLTGMGLTGVMARRRRNSGNNV